MEIRYFVHDADILRLTAQYNVDHDEIYSLGGIPGDLAVATNRALVERDRGAVVDYWRTFLHEFESGTYDIDTNGLFRWEFNLTYED